MNKEDSGYLVYQEDVDKLVKAWLDLKEKAEKQAAERCNCIFGFLLEGEKLTLFRNSEDVKNKYTMFFNYCPLCGKEIWEKC